MRWGMFFLAEFIEIVFISAVISSVFFGGYQFPFLDPDGFRIGGWIENGASVGGYTWLLPHWAVAAIQFARRTGSNPFTSSMRGCMNSVVCITWSARRPISFSIRVRRRARVFRSATRMTSS